MPFHWLGRICVPNFGFKVGNALNNIHSKNRNHVHEFGGYRDSYRVCDPEAEPRLSE